MELTDRQMNILAEIRSDGRVEVDGLADSFSVTTQTIRRDLAQLCDRGLAARTHGGAKRLLSVSNVGYEDRRRIQIDVKERLGICAASLIPSDCSITLNIGTTTEQVAYALSEHSDLVVLSNNVNIITAFMGSKMKELILVGGSVRQSDGAIVGADAVEFISRYKVDYAVIGASALDSDGAILDFDTREVSVARAILKNARTKILVCDSTKFEKSAPVRICHVGDLDYFVTDVKPPDSFVAAAGLEDTKILLADRP
ncbi:MAG: DeoR/GlpR family DNA-binding transcription regulator [Marinosulfonomonas sp.]|nr:DeoR/GlpR family DNA-binding transcription regulator [Marinosulfonomonas sp.]